MLLLSILEVMSSLIPSKAASAAPHDHPTVRAPSLMRMPLHNALQLHQHVQTATPPRVWMLMASKHSTLHLCSITAAGSPWQQGTHHLRQGAVLHNMQDRPTPAQYAAFSKQSRSLNSAGREGGGGLCPT